MKLTFGEMTGNFNNWADTVHAILHARRRVHIAETVTTDEQMPDAGTNRTINAE
jgi:hypothetical protein